MVSCLGYTAEQVVHRRSSRVAAIESVESPGLRADRTTGGENGAEWLHLNPSESSCTDYTGAANLDGADYPVDAGQGDGV